MRRGPSCGWCRLGHTSDVKVALEVMVGSASILVREHSDEQALKSEEKEDFACIASQIWLITHNSPA